MLLLVLLAVAGSASGVFGQKMLPTAVLQLQPDSLVADALANHVLSFTLHSFEVVFFMNYKLELTFAHPFVLPDSPPGLRALLSIGDRLANAIIRPQVNGNNVTLDPLDYLTYEHFGRIQEAFAADARDQQIPVSITLLDIRNPATPGPHNVTADFRSNFRDVSLTRADFSFTFHKETRAKSFRIHSTCGFIGNGFYSSAMRVLTLRDLSEEVELHLFGNTPNVRVVPSVVRLSKAGVGVPVSLVVPRQEIGPNSRRLITIFAKSLSDGKLAKVEEFEDFQIEVIDLASPSALETFKSEPAECFPRLSIYPYLQHFLPGVPTPPIDARFSHALSSPLTLHAPGQPMFRSENVTVQPSTLFLPAGGDSFSFRLNITGLKFFEFRLSMNLEVIDVNHFDSIDLKDFFRSLSASADAAERPPPSLLDSPDFLAVKNYFLRKMNFFSRDPFAKHKPIESLSFIFLINDQPAPFRLDSLDLGPATLGPAHLASLLRSLDDLRASKLTRFSSALPTISAPDRFHLVATQPFELCVVAVPRHFAPNFLLKSVITDSYHRFCRPSTDHVAPFNYSVPTNHPSFRVLKKTSDSLKEQFQVRLSLRGPSPRSETVFAFATTQFGEPFFLKTLFLHTPSPSPPPSACLLTSHLPPVLLESQLPLPFPGFHSVHSTFFSSKHPRVPHFPLPEPKTPRFRYLVFGNSTFTAAFKAYFRDETRKDPPCYDASALASLDALKPKLRLVGVRGDGADFQVLLDARALRFRRFLSFRFAVVVKNLSGNRLLKLVLSKRPGKRSFSGRLYAWNMQGFRSFDRRWSLRHRLSLNAHLTAKHTLVLPISFGGLRKYHFYRFDSTGCLRHRGLGLSECREVPSNQREISTDDFQYKIRRLGSAGGAVLSVLASLLAATAVWI